MPLPVPNKGEEKQHFISRCIAFERKANSNRPLEQVQAMCYTAYETHIKQEKGKDMNYKVDIESSTFGSLSNSKIDKDKSIIKHVAIMCDTAVNTAGQIIRRFTDKALNSAIHVFDQAIARLDHIGNDGVVKSGFGVFQNIVREDNKIFGDLQLWECPEAEKVMSIAERTPNATGFSIHTAGVIQRSEDGVDVFEELLDRAMDGGRPTIDLVDDPAATTGIFQDKNKSNTSKENQMEFKDITLQSLKDNRNDLYQEILKEGSKSRDAEVTKLIQEKDQFKSKCDEYDVKCSKAEKEVLVAKLLQESDLPDYAITDAFKLQLMSVKESKTGDKTVTVEDGVKALIQDRLDVISPSGVQDNHEKVPVTHKKNNDNVVSDDEFADAFKS